MVHIARAAYPLILAWRNANVATKEKMPYGELANQLGGLSPRILSGPLGHIVERCRIAGLPALSALVVAGPGSVDSLPGPGYPGQGYYPAAHGVEYSHPQSIVMWKAELARVWAEKGYPPQLP